MPWITLLPGDPTDPLIIAVKANDLNSVRSLYASDPKTNYLFRIAAFACYHDKPDILNWTFTEGFVLPTTSENSELVLGAFSSRSIPIFSILLSHGFDLNENWCEANGTSLTIAIQHGDIAFAKFLLENGMNPGNTGDGNDIIGVNIIGTIVGESASNEMLKLLLEYGFKPPGTAAAIAAAETGNVEALRWLVEAGADLEEVTEGGGWWPRYGMDNYDYNGTALYRACLAGKIETVKWLLDKGADFRFMDEAGRSCEVVAAEGGFEEIVAILREKEEEEKT